MSSTHTQSALLFNGPLETGIRTLIVLNAAYPAMYDLSYLTWLDHLVVHTGDIGGPDSLHPPLPSRNGELLVRRSIIQHGISLMRRLRLVDVVPSEDGILYRAGNDSYSFVGLLRTSYSRSLKERARWLADCIGQIGPDAFRALVLEKIGQWDIEFNKSNHASHEAP